MRKRMVWLMMVPVQILNSKRNYFLITRLPCQLYVLKGNQKMLSHRVHNVKAKDAKADHIEWVMTAFSSSHPST